MMGQSEGTKVTSGGPLSKPLSVEDLGVSRGLLTDLVLKTLYLEGEMDGTDIADRMKVPLPVAVTPPKGRWSSAPMVGALT